MTLRVLLGGCHGVAYAGLKDYTCKSGDWLIVLELWGGPDVPARGG